MADPGRSAAEAPDRYQLFAAGWRRAECPLTLLWVQYLGLGGTADLFTIDAFMHGVATLPPAEQDILTNAINEELDDLYQAAKVPYLLELPSGDDPRDPLTILDGLVRRPPRDGSDAA